MNEWLEQKIKDAKCFLVHHDRFYCDDNDGVVYIDEMYNGVRYHKLIVVPWKCSHCQKTVMNQIIHDGGGFMVVVK
jgi:hypothetical protein